LFWSVPFSVDGRDSRSELEGKLTKRLVSHLESLYCPLSEQAVSLFQISRLETDIKLRIGAVRVAEAWTWHQTFRHLI
jgi:hypothetical protein